MLSPDNFFFFLILFTVNISMAVFLLFSYKRNTILWLNAIVFLIAAIRCTCEYYIQTQEDFATIYPYTVTYGFSYWASGLLTICTWLYIRPLKGYSFERIVGRIYIGVILFWGVVSIYPTYHRLMYYMPTEKIDGFWQYITLQNEWSYFYFAGHLGFMTISSAVYLLDYWRGNRWDIRKIVYIFFITYFPAVGNSTVFFANGATDYIIPDIGLFYTLTALICSWFFSGYRIFNEQVTEIVQDTFDSISDLVFLVDKKYKVLQANQSVDLLFGKGNAVGTTLDFVLAGDNKKDSVKYNEMLFNLSSGQIKETDMDLDVKDKKRSFKVKASKMKKGKQVTGYTFVFNDVTDLKATQDQLSEQNYVKDRIFGVLGHDLRKPAISFQGIAKKVNYLLEKKDYKRLLGLGKNIEENAVSLVKLTDNLLQWALAQRNVVPYQPMYIDLSELIDEVVLSLNMLIMDKGVKVENRINFGHSAYADMNALKTIVRNLLDNAVKYSVEGDSIVFESKLNSDGNSLVLSIRDEGTGIPFDKMDGLFKIQRGKSEVGTSGEKGTGLGLHLVHELVQLNKGNIYVESAVQEGTTFYIELPIKREHISQIN